MAKISRRRSKGNGGTITLLAVELQDRERLFGVRLRELTPAMVKYRAAVRDAVTDALGSEWTTHAFADRRVFAFDRASHAFRAALGVVKAVRAIQVQGLGCSVRCAVMAGEVDALTEERCGHLVQRARALAAHCPGNQVLSNGAAMELAREALGPAFAFRDLGAHPLELGGEPERIAMVQHPELACVDAPQIGTDQPVGEVPTRSEFFFGRFDEIEALHEMIERRRILTLRGPGGIGKTALAQRVAREESANFQDGVRYVDLSRAVRTGDPIAEIGMALGKSSAGTEAVLQALAERDMLVVLDGIDGFEEDIRKFLKSAVRACPGVRFLVTGSRSLRASGEAVFDVPPLSLPEPRDVPTPEEAEQYDAVALFVDRVQARMPDFALGPLNVAPVVAICRRLDGIPLALELVASRADRLSLEQMLACLEKSREASAEALPMGPMDEALSWSINQLDPYVRTVLHRLSVIRGSWTAELAIAVGSGDGLTDKQVDQALHQLVEASLVSRHYVAGRGTRYRLLELIRQHAEGSYGDADQVQGSQVRLGRAVLAALQAARKRERGALERAADILGCIEPCFDAAIDRGDLAFARELVVTSFVALWRHGEFVLGANLAERLLALGKPRDEYSTVQLLNMSGVFSAHLGRSEHAVRQLLRAVVLARRQARADALPGLYGNLADVYRTLGKVHEAASLYQVALEDPLQRANRQVAGQLILNRCLLYLGFGMLDEAGGDLEVYATLGPTEDVYEERRLRLIRARYLLARGELSAAEELALEALQIALSHSDEPSVLAAARLLAIRLAQLQDYAAATLAMSAIREGCLRLGTASFVGEADWMWLSETLDGALPREEATEYEERGAMLDTIGLGRYLMHRYGLEIMT